MPPHIKQDMVLKMLQWCIKVCMLLLLLQPCHDYHKIMSVTKGVKAVSDIFLNFILHDLTKKQKDEQ